MNVAETRMRRPESRRIALRPWRTFMRRMPSAAAWFFLLLAPLVPRTAAGGEEPLRFLQALRENGYGDMAVEYLRILNGRPDLAENVRDVWDLEMSKSLRAAAADAYNLWERNRLLAEVDVHLEKFVREHSDRPAVASVITIWGERLAQRGLDRLSAAKRLSNANEMSDAAEKRRDELLADARDDLEQAGKQFVRARDKYEEQLAALPKLDARSATRYGTGEERSTIEEELMEARFQIPLIDYHLAQTYPDPADARRAKALRRAAEGFDAIFQRDRLDGALTLLGLRAHTWHGKTAEALGDLQLAADIYDEVLVSAAEPGERRVATGLEPLFAQVEYLRMMILAKRKPEEFIDAATAWLKRNRRYLCHTEGYQGIALETAKALRDKAVGAAGEEKTRGIAEALRMLADLSKTRGPHQQEAILLRHELLQASGRPDVEIDTFDEAVALADAAAAKSQWERASDLYRRAIDIAGPDASRLAEIDESLAGAEFMLARGLFDRGRFNECIETVANAVFADREKKTVRRDSAAAARASALAVNAALKLYAAAAENERSKILDRLNQLAAFTETNWPDRPEADDARMARGQAKLVDNRVRDAIDIFERVNPKSPRFAQAMYYAGQNYARLYLAEKNKPAEQRGRRADDRLAGPRRRAASRRIGIPRRTKQTRSSAARLFC